MRLESSAKSDDADTAPAYDDRTVLSRLDLRGCADLAGALARPREASGDALDATDDGALESVRAIIDDYLGRPATDFDVAEYGFALDGLEQRRRWLLKSLLRADGVRRDAYEVRFGSTVDDDFPQLTRLAEHGYLF